MKNILYTLAGLFFGLVLVKSEAVSWYRIAEMFHFQSFHMYGVIGTAVTVGAASVFLIKKWKLKDAKGNLLQLKEKPKMAKANLLGGIIFGTGWAIVGACPGPLFIHVGAGRFLLLIPILSAFLGVILYGILKNKLPH